MVLENVTDSMSKDSFTDGAPSSDMDPYEGGSPSDSGYQQSYNIDSSNFPKPVPIFGVLFGYNGDRLNKVCATKFANAHKILKRPVTEEEATALAYWSSKQLSIMSYGPVVGIGGGLWRCYSTTSTFQFPFWQPNLEKFQSNVFPPRFPVLRGIRAVAAWHVLRALAYSWMGNYIGQILVGSYATSVSVVGEFGDPRLKAYREGIMEDAKKRKGALPSIGQQGQVGSRNPQRQQGGMPTMGMNGQADASPTGGMFEQTNMSSTSGAYDTTAQTGPERSQWPLASPAPHQEPMDDTQNKSFDMFDDASPTGGAGIMADTTPATAQGSAWDRLRKGEKPAPIRPRGSSQSAWSKQNQAQREQRGEGSNIDDGYTFSKSDEERSYAKDEAQKEFDARIERERRGGNFNSGNGRW